MKRVLIVDDSATCRAFLSTVIGGAAGLEVVGVATDGRAGVEEVRRLRPDVVAMDLHMPRLDGLAATREIMASAPTPVVIVTATGRADDVSLGLDALRAGALAVLRKPLGVRSPGFADDARRLADTLRDMAEVKVVRRWRPDPGPASATPTPAGPPLACRAVAVAASTGGPAALAELVAGLPADFPAPVFVVQHIAPGFVDGLASWLERAGRLRVRLAAAGDRPAPGTVYVAPDGRHLVVSSGTVLLTRDEPVGGFRPSADVLLASVGREYGAHAVGVVLTGMGTDGANGAKELKARGGRVIAQDEASSAVYGMPAAVVAAGLADWVLPPRAIAARLAGAVRA